MLDKDRWTEPDRVYSFSWYKRHRKDLGWATLYQHKYARPKRCTSRYYGHALKPAAVSYLVRDLQRILRSIDHAKYDLVIKDRSDPESPFHDVQFELRSKTKSQASSSSPCGLGSGLSDEAQRFEEMGWRMSESERV